MAMPVLRLRGVWKGGLPCGFYAHPDRLDIAWRLSFLRANQVTTTNLHGVSHIM
jgi:hypothetical protein